MAARLIAKIAESSEVNGNYIICKTDEVVPGPTGPREVWITKNEFFGKNGEVAWTSNGWTQHFRPQLHRLLMVHFEMSSEEADEILSR